MPTNEETVDAIAENIDIDIQKYCSSKVNRDENYVHCHVISRDDVRNAVNKLKSSKIDEDGRFYSESIIHGTGLLFEYIGKLLSAMICHSYDSTSFIKCSIIPIPKGTRANLTDSEKYRSIAISSLLSKLLDYVIIKQQNISLKTSDYQFGFKPESSTILCTTMVKETIQYYSENGGKPVHLLLLDARKTFDKVAYDKLFKVLIEKNVCPKIVRLLLYMYTNQQCYVQWGDARSDTFKIFNGVKQGGMISPILFTIYIDQLFQRLKQLGLGCHVGMTYAGAFGYADDIALVAPSIYCLKEMVNVCEQFAHEYHISFNPSKSKLMSFNLSRPLGTPIYLNGQKVEVVDHDSHLGNYVATDLRDINITKHVCDLYQRSNNVISDFNVCDSVTLDALPQTYCMHMYGCELWNLNCTYVSKFITAWRKIKRRIWNLPYTTHNNIVYNLSSDIRLQLDKRIVTFIYNALNSSNCASRSLLQSKLHCTGSTFASNYRHLSYKYNICEEDWFSGLSHLLGKVKMRFAEINKSCTYSTQALIELCGIRDSTIQCNILNQNEVCALIDVLSTN